MITLYTCPPTKYDFDKTVRFPSEFFRAFYKCEYSDLPIVKRILKEIDEIDFVRGEYVDVGSNNISDLSPISDLKKIRSLEFYYNNVGDLTALSNLTTLQTLTMYNNPFEKIEPIQNLTNLTRLSFFENNIQPESYKYLPYFNIKCDVRIDRFLTNPSQYTPHLTWVETGGNLYTNSYDVEVIREVITPRYNGSKVVCQTIQLKQLI